MELFQKFCYQLFCVNFFSSSGHRNFVFALHLTYTIIAALLVKQISDDESSFPKALNHNHTFAAIGWYFCYNGIYTIMILEGFLKDPKFNRRYTKHIKALCEKQYKNRKDYTPLFTWTFVGLDVVYLILMRCSGSYHIAYHNSCVFPKICFRFRLASYLHISRSVLWELEEVIEKLEKISRNATEEEVLKLQHEYSDLWKISQYIGGYYAWSLCFFAFHIFFDVILYLFWFFTVDFADFRRAICE